MYVGNYSLMFLEYLSEVATRSRWVLGSSTSIEHLKRTATLTIATI